MPSTLPLPLVSKAEFPLSTTSKIPSLSESKSTASSILSPSESIDRQACVSWKATLLEFISEILLYSISN
jgi:hypothetical protein